MTISYITLGCKLNYAETSTYERKLSGHGFETVPWSKGADVFLVNTCTVTEHSDKKSRNISSRTEIILTPKYVDILDVLSTGKDAASMGANSGVGE